MIKEISRLLAGAALATLALVPAVRAQDAKAEQPAISKLWHATYDVQKDGRVTETVTTRTQVLQENMLERAKVHSISYSSSIQTAEILDAFTVKKDGREVRVPPGNYQTETSDGRKGAGPMFSDRSRISVVFPDLAVGDAVHVRYRIVEKEPMFPGQFSMAYTFTPFAVYEDVRLKVRYPKDMPLKTETHFFQVTPPATEGDMAVLEWRWQNLQPQRYDEEDSGLWKQDEIPSVLVSTFANYEAIAKAYGDRALPKAQPTARIQALVRDALSGETRPREKARLLYEWVSRNITYGGNCIGVGAVVPRDVDVVLDNKMGDCKDHATLLQAMLAAAGIRSEQVLINAGSEYELPATPVVSKVNHVINFLPEFGLYVDATAKEIPFGYLPAGSYSKPVIHIGTAKALATIPPEKPADNQQDLKMMLKVADSGAATGTVRVAVKGVGAAYLRASHRELTADQEREFVKRALASYGYRGKGTLEKGDTKGLSDSYEYAIKFDIDNFLRAGANGAFVFYPVVGTPLPVTMFSDVDERPTPKRSEVCHGFSTAEAYTIEFPASMTLLAMPEDAHVGGRMIDFHANYQRAGNVVTVKRAVHDKTSQGICSAEVMTQFLKEARPLGEHLRTQVLYKRKVS